MKPPLQKSPIPQEHAFVIRHLKENHFDPNWHFHSEFQGPGYEMCRYL
jgi:hypothetical protein